MREEGRMDTDVPNNTFLSTFICPLLAVHDPSHMRGTVNRSPSFQILENLELMRAVSEAVLFCFVVF